MTDTFRLFKTYYSIQLSQALKSPINFWTSTLIQVVYFFAQWVFWVGIRSTDAGAGWMNQRELLGFLVTVAVVDNFYLFFIGRGSMVMATRIQARTLDSILLWPRSALATLVWSSPNWSYFPCVLLSLLAFGAYHSYFGTAVSLIVIHMTACILGMFVMNGISYLFRITCFWSSAFARLRNANPSYKIMVRPFDAFDAKVRLGLLTILPALFITGVPAELAIGRLPAVWLIGALAACGAVWLQIAWLWKRGVARYGRSVT